ncbi:MAG: site-specific DNA-methyltransferase [Planctomycetes bacterium]|nr:site-specific DNA-methyltransferase [Planctomycetota bacterium]MBU1518241.1 site-specific DNA-methyltransferase [Planctomycetota bacterium]MBU2457090.1 site-specific DNA-methyltransferase [Planctomycetota bacterium]MBU2596359.1 site-specific DNA-methyltransferase [Planctomycetota bacterium]
MIDAVLNIDAMQGIKQIEDNSLDLIIADPPYGLGKDYGNDSDKRPKNEFLKWTEEWLELIIPKLKNTGSLYIFATWRYSPEIFVFLKQRMIMLNEIIWDRKVPSMGGSTRRYSSVHDTIGFFAKTQDHFFDIDAIRIPYDAETKKARSRSIFVGKKWLEVGYNPKDLWSVSRLHRIHSERENHPTQKPLEIIERMVKASCPTGGLVCDPFAGSGTTVEACVRNERHYIAFEINPEYHQIIEDRIKRVCSEIDNCLPLRSENQSQNIKHPTAGQTQATLFESHRTSKCV